MLCPRNPAIRVIERIDLIESWPRYILKLLENDQISSPYHHATALWWELASPSAQLAFCSLLQDMSCVGSRMMYRIVMEIVETPGHSGHVDIPSQITLNHRISDLSPGHTTERDDKKSLCVGKVSNVKVFEIGNLVYNAKCPPKKRDKTEG